MAPAPLRPRSGDWQDSYRAALFETDKHEIPNRIAEAEKEIIIRGRELLKSPQSSKEREALDAALYGLRAFRSSLRRSGATGPSFSAGAWTIHGRFSLPR
jgi:hypothetical protein